MSAIMSVSRLATRCSRSPVMLYPLRRSTTLGQEAQKFMAKHRGKKSPMSPYVQYQPQLTWLLSITHRITGLGLGVVIYSMGWATLAASSSNYEQILAKFKSTMPGWFIDTIKVLCVSGLAFHTFNGVRHLFWDAGYGFGLKELYKSGYFVLGLTVLATIAYLLKE